MKFVINDGKTVVCPECYAHIHLPRPVQAGQVVLCHACRVRIEIFQVGGVLDARVLPESASTEDKTW